MLKSWFYWRRHREAIIFTSSYLKNIDAFTNNLQIAVKALFYNYNIILHI